jgi:hypothetical protein
MHDPTTDERLNRLLDALAELVPSDQRIEPPGQAGPFELRFDVDSRRIRLICRLEATPPRITVACPLGPVPDHDRGTVLRQLLRLNLATAWTGTHMGCDPVTQDLYALHALTLLEATPARLHNTVHALIQWAEQWDEDPSLAHLQPRREGDGSPDPSRLA